MGQASCCQPWMHSCCALRSWHMEGQPFPCDAGVSRTNFSQNLLEPRIYMPPGCTMTSQFLLHRLKIKFQFVKMSIAFRGILGKFWMNSWWLLSLFKILNSPIKFKPSTPTKPLHSFSPKTSIDKGLKLQGRTLLFQIFLHQFCGILFTIKLCFSSFNLFLQGANLLTIFQDFLKVSISKLKSCDGFLHKIFDSMCYDWID